MEGVILCVCRRDNTVGGGGDRLCPWFQYLSCGVKMFTFNKTGIVRMLERMPYSILIVNVLNWKQYTPLT